MPARYKWANGRTANMEDRRSRSGKTAGQDTILSMVATRVAPYLNTLLPATEGIRGEDTITLDTVEAAQSTTQ